MVRTYESPGTLAWDALGRLVADLRASGQLDASAVRCVLCGKAPCDCPPFGGPGYLALVDRLHGRARGGEA